MRITPTDAKAFSKAVFAWTDAGEIRRDQEDDFVEWGLKYLESAELGLGAFDLPPQFHGLWRKFIKSKGYNPDTEALALALEQQANPAPVRFGPHTQPKTTINMKTGSSFLQRFDQLTGGTKSTFGSIETARRDGSDSELDSSVRRAFNSLAREQRMSCGDAVRKILMDPEKEAIYDALGRKFLGGRLTTEDSALLQKALVGGVQKAFTPGISPSDDFGGGMFLAAAVSDDVLYASYQYSAWKDLGWRVLAGARMKYVNITQPAQGVWITPSQQGKVTLPSDAFLSGDAACDLANTIAALVEMSLDLVQDGGAALSEAVLRGLSEGHGKAVEYAAFQGNGTDDPLNGAQTGIFMDGNIACVPAANGNTSVGALQRDDFIGAVAAVDPSALTRAPRWFISVALLPKLLKLRDGQGPKYLLHTPAQTEGEWELVGFPVTWSIAAPGNDLAGQKVAAFGAPDGYLVALQEKMEIMASDSARFTAFVRQLRLINRGWVQTRQSNWFATLKLAAQ